MQINSINFLSIMFLLSFISFFNRKILMFIRNVNLWYFFMILILIGIMYLQNNVFSLWIFSNNCWEFIVNKQWYCQYFNKKIFLLLPEIIFFFVYFSYLQWLMQRESEQKTLVEKMVSVVVLYIIFRFITYYVDYWFLHKEFNIFGQLFVYGFMVIMTYDLMYEKWDFNLSALKWLRNKSQWERKNVDKIKEIKVDKNRDVYFITRNQLFPILQKAFSEMFKKELDEWESTSDLLKFVWVEKISDEKVFLKIDMHNALKKNIDKVSKNNWLKIVHAWWKVDSIHSIFLLSKDGNNGFLVDYMFVDIDFKNDIIAFPKLSSLVDKELSIQDYIKSIPALFSSPLWVYLWKNRRWKDMFLDFASFPHMLVAWETWWGKSTMIANMIVSLLLQKLSWVPIILNLIDPKKTEFSFYKNLSWVRVTTSVVEWINILRYYAEEMWRRNDLFSSKGFKDIWEYNKANSEKIPYVVNMIDEIWEIMESSWKDHKNEFESLVKRIAQLGRSTWIHILLATQVPKAEVLSTTIRWNLPTRIGCKVWEQQISKMILWWSWESSQLASKIKYKWEYYIKYNWDIHRVKWAFIPTDNIKKLVSFIMWWNDGVSIHQDKKDGIVSNNTSIKPKINNTINSIDNKSQEEGVSIHHENKGVSIHQASKNKDNNNQNQLFPVEKKSEKFEKYIESNCVKQIDIFSSEFAVLRYLLDNDWYKNRDTFDKHCRIYWISKESLKSIIENLKQKEFLVFDSSDKYTYLKVDNNKQIMEVYNTIYNSLSFKKWKNI